MSFDLTKKGGPGRRGESPGLQFQLQSWGGGFFPNPSPSGLSRRNAEAVARRAAGLPAAAVSRAGAMGFVSTVRAAVSQGFHAGEDLDPGVQAEATTTRRTG